MALTHNETIIDGIENYGIGPTISRTSAAKISVATCRRGRLKGRKVALKMISRNKDSETLSEESYRAKLQLHRHLHHPDILAILSTFETPSAFYEILEYAPYGSLSEWISSPQSNSEFGVTYTMTESELRGVLQPLIKALLHMHQNEVLHLNVNPTTIFLTSDYRVKLGGFQYSRNYSTKLSPFLQKKNGFVLGQDAPIHHQKSVFSAPEILMQERFGPPADAWSLGQLCVLLSNGSLEDGLWNQSIPQSASYELRDLIEGLTQPDAVDRTPLRRVLSHPFFNPTLPTDSLSGFIGSRSRYRSRPIYETSLGRHVLVPLNTSQFWPSVEPSKTISSRKTPFSTEGSKSNERDPISLNPVGGCSFITSQRLPLPVQDNTYILGSVETLKGRNLNEFNSVELESKRPASPRPTRRGVNLPRKVLSAGGLPPQTFRTTHGMIIIQLSREVVVDLREGERLKGRNGGVILVAQSDGNKIDVYSAPHLSIPCVLQKPVSTWELNQLPSQLARPYEFAAKYLYAVKRKTPMVTLNLSTSKFVMMSNTPLPDIEVTVSPSRSGHEESLEHLGTTIRLRYSRQENMLEISKFIDVDQTGFVSQFEIQPRRKAPRSGVSEWCKRLIPLLGGSIDMAEIREDERKAVSCLLDSRHLWERLEKTAFDMDLRVTNGLSDQFLTIRSHLNSNVDAVHRRGPLPPRESPKENISFYPSPASSTEPENNANTTAKYSPRRQPPVKPRLLGLGLPPRPRKLSLLNPKSSHMSPMTHPTVLRRHPGSVHWDANIKKDS